MEDLVFHAVVLDALGLERVDVVGLSLAGGWRRSSRSGIRGVCIGSCWGMRRGRVCRAWCASQVGSMPHEMAMKNIKLFAKEVMPAIRAEFP